MGIVEGIYKAVKKDPVPILGIVTLAAGMAAQAYVENSQPKVTTGSADSVKTPTGLAPSVEAYNQYIKVYGTPTLAKPPQESNLVNNIDSDAKVGCEPYNPRKKITFFESLLGIKAAEAATPQEEEVLATTREEFLKCLKENVDVHPELQKSFNLETLTLDNIEGGVTFDGLRPLLKNHGYTDAQTDTILANQVQMLFRTETGAIVFGTAIMEEDSADVEAKRAAHIKGFFDRSKTPFWFLIHQGSKDQIGFGNCINLLPPTEETPPTTTPTPPPPPAPQAPTSFPTPVPIVPQPPGAAPTEGPRPQPFNTPKPIAAQPTLAAPTEGPRPNSTPNTVSTISPDTQKAPTAAATAALAFPTPPAISADTQKAPTAVKTTS